VGLDKPLTASTCSFYFGFVGLGMGMVEAIYNCSTTKKFFWMTATTFMILCGTEEYMGDSVLYIREPKIAECSKNARNCNILLEIFHIFLFFTKKITFPYSCLLLVSIYPFVLINLLSTITFTRIHYFSDILTKNYPLFF
jgi:hypothetical protein